MDPAPEVVFVPLKSGLAFVLLLADAVAKAFMSFIDTLAL